MQTPIITLTESACAHIRNFAQGLGKDAGLRVAVKKSGCSGFAYIVDVVEKPRADDLYIKQDDINIFIGADSKEILQGTVLDLVDKGAGQKQLVFNNPNVVDSCGCGESFTVKDAKEG